MNKKCKIVHIDYYKKCKIEKKNLNKIEKIAFLCYSNHGGVNYV